MPCYTRLKPRQTISQRADEIRRAMEKINRGIAEGRIKAKVGPQGAVAFLGISEQERDGITDACVYRRVMATGSAMAKQAIARAEMLAGRSVDRKALAAGWHSHDSGKTWGHH